MRWRLCKCMVKPVASCLRRSRPSVARPVRAKRVGDRCRWRRMAAVAFVGEVGVSENHVRQPGSTKIPEEPPLGEKRELAGREGCASKRLSQNNTMLNTTLRRPSGSHDSPPSQREGRLISRFNLGALLLSIPASRADDSLAGATCHTRTFVWQSHSGKRALSCKFHLPLRVCRNQMVG